PLMAGAAGIGARADAHVGNRILRAPKTRFHHPIGHRRSPVAEFIPADPSEGVAPVLHPIIVGVHVTHFQRRAVRPDPGFLEFLAAAGPLTAGEPLRIDLLAAADQLLELLIAFAEQDPMPMLAVLPRDILGEVSQQKIRFAPEYGAT